MKKLYALIGIILVAALAGYLGASWHQPLATVAHKENVYERVVRTGTLRCGYYLYPPMLMRNVNTGQFSGIAADVMQAIGQRLNLKIEWTAEFGFATAVTDIQNQRFDLACIGFWRLPNEAKFLGYSMPFVYSHMQAYVRAADTRFDGNVQRINQPDITMVAADGMMAVAVAAADFPNAKLHQLPNLTTPAQLFEEVASGKADVFLTDAALGVDYMRANPGKIKAVAGIKPIRTFQSTLAMAIDEPELKMMIDSALIDIIENGELDKILARYDAAGQSYLKPAPQYLLPVLQ